MGFAALALVGCASVAPAAAVRSPSPHSWSVSCVASAHRVSLDLSPNPLDLSDGADEALRVTARAGSSPPEVVPLSATIYVPLPPVIDSMCKETVGVTAGEDRLLVLLALDGRPNLDYLLAAVLLEASTGRSIAVRQLIAEILEPMEVSIVKNGVRLTAICRDNPDNRNDGPSGVLFDSLTIAAVGDEIHVEWPAASKCDRARKE